MCISTMSADLNLPHAFSGGNGGYQLCAPGLITRFDHLILQLAAFTLQEDSVFLARITKKTEMTWRG